MKYPHQRSRNNSSNQIPHLTLPIHILNNHTPPYVIPNITPNIVHHIFHHRRRGFEERVLLLLLVLLRHRLLLFKEDCACIIAFTMTRMREERNEKGAEGIYICVVGERKREKNPDVSKIV